MDDDWIMHFFEQSSKTSDEKVQEIWARILAGEANKPGSYSKRTINFLTEIEKGDAELFGKLCNFVWYINNSPYPLIPEPTDPIYSRNGINFEGVQHLESLGLINLDATAGYQLSNKDEGTSNHFILSYNKRYFLCEIPEGREKVVQIGKVMLTKLGRELLMVCPLQVIEKLEEYIQVYYESTGNKLREITAQSLTHDDTVPPS